MISGTNCGKSQCLQVVPCLKHWDSKTIKWKEKQHVNVHVKGTPALELDPDVIKYMDFGSCNEINAITTLVGLIMPALPPLSKVL